VRCLRTDLLVVFAEKKARFGGFVSKNNRNFEALTDLDARSLQTTSFHDTKQKKWRI